MHAPAGLPSVDPGFILPEDVREFYQLCGGAELFLSTESPLSLVRPADFLPTNLVLLGEQFPDDITASWYVIARASSRELISIDLQEARLGRVYDSFDEIHGVAGSCPIIAASFTAFVTSLLGDPGGRYWLRPTFRSAAPDAYDPSP